MQDPLIKQPPQKSLFGTNDSLRIFIFELLGTIILSFGILCSQYIPPLNDKVDNPFHDIFVSLSLYLAIVICAPLTGGHFNPSVTFGFFFLKKQNMAISKLILYLLAQSIGAAIGVMLAKAFYDCQIIPYSGQVDNIFTIIGHGVGQFLGAFLFIFMILIVVHPDTTFTTEVSWIQIFIPTVLFIARSFSYHIGGVNPAVVSMFQIQGAINHSLQGITILYILILDIFSVAGAFSASKFYQNVHSVALKSVMSQ